MAPLQESEMGTERKGGGEDLVSVSLLQLSHSTKFDIQTNKKIAIIKIHHSRKYGIIEGGKGGGKGEG